MKKEEVGESQGVDESKSIYSKEGMKEEEKKNLQQFYSSVLGDNPAEIKNNSKLMRNKIYRFGAIVLVVVGIFYFFVIGKITFVSG